MEVLFAHYRCLWPNEVLEPEFGGSPYSSGAPPSCHSGLEPSNSTASLGSEQTEPEDMDDLELAKALGVPDHHIERLTPVKAKPGPTLEANPIEPSTSEIPPTQEHQEPKSKPNDSEERAQWRATRIEELKWHVLHPKWS